MVNWFVNSHWIVKHVIVVSCLLSYGLIFGWMSWTSLPLNVVVFSLLTLPFTAVGVYIYRASQRRKQKAPTRVPDA